MEVNKKELKEQEIRTLFITPALQQKGWAVSVNMREEYYFTDGRVLVVGNQHSVAEGKKADYLLYHKGKPIAVVEAKDNKHAVVPLQWLPRYGQPLCVDSILVRGYGHHNKKVFLQY